MDLTIATNGTLKNKTLACLPMPFDKADANNYYVQDITMRVNSKVDGPIVFQYIGESNLKNLLKSDWTDVKEDPDGFLYEYRWPINSTVVVNNSVYVVDPVNGNTLRYQEAYGSLGINDVDVPTRVKIVWTMVNV